MTNVGRTNSSTLLYHASSVACKTLIYTSFISKEFQPTIFRALTAPPSLSFRSDPINNKLSFDGYCDAALSKILTDPYDDRLGFIIFCRCGSIAHLLHWDARKLRRVARSSATAEILAADETVDVLLYLQALLNDFYYLHTAGLVTDLKVTFEFSTSIRKYSVPINKVALATIQESFCTTLHFFIRWCLGSHHAADPLTKDNHAAASGLSHILRDVIYPRHLSKTECPPEILDAFLPSH